MAHSSAAQIRAWQGPALFSFGFRPFFLFGALWVALTMVIWLAMLSGRVTLPTRFDPVSWHAHAFLFGYLSAIIAGFLLTAVPNWTGRLPMVGWPLAALFALWVLGRIAVLFSALMPALVAMAIDLAFPLVLGGMILTEIIAGKNWRNLIVLLLLASFTLANALFHLEHHWGDYAAQGIGLRLGVATAILMIAVIGGRIIPSFTRNWLARTGKTARPTPPMQRFDKAVILFSLPVLIYWVLQPLSALTGGALLIFGLLHLIRLSRWKGAHTSSDPLVWVLHASYAFVPLGAFAIGLALISGKGDPASAQHLWMSGAIGAMTLAVMTRATLGHTGQPLIASKATQMIYFSLFAAVLARFGVTFFPILTSVSGLFWLLAFVGFAGVYGPLLIRPKPSKGS